MKKEVLLSIDSYAKPKEDLSPEALLVSTLLLKRPGTSPAHPYEGFYLNKYRFKEIEDNIITIQNEFKEQCEKYLPDIYVDDIKVQKVDDKTLVLGISIIGEKKKEQEFITFKITEQQKGKLLAELI